MLGFNNTGNVCVWPAEEALAAWCLGRAAHFDGKRVLELGGGMASLAGLAVARASQVRPRRGRQGRTVHVHNLN